MIKTLTAPCVYDNCKGCVRKCEHAGKDREFICAGGKTCKETERSENQVLFEKLADMEEALFYASNQNHAFKDAHDHLRQALVSFATATGCHN